MTLYVGTLLIGMKEVIYISSEPIDSEDFENNNFILNNQPVPSMEGSLNIVRNVLSNGGATVVMEQ